MSALLGEIVKKHFDEHILPFDEMSARAYSVIMNRGRSMGRAISIPDGQIAAVAQVHHLTVATRDTSPFEVAEISFTNPWEHGQPL